MPRPIKKRAPKSETREENIQHTLEQFRETAAARQNQIIVGVVLIIAIVAAVLGFMYLNAGTERKAAELEYMGYKEFNALNVEIPDPKDLRAERALPYFKQAMEMRPTPFSQYYIGLCYYELGEYDSAVDALQGLVDDYPDESRFVPPGLYKLGMAHLRSGRNEQALETFGRFRKVGIRAFGDLALLESARILESMGKMEESVTMYETLSFEYPSSVFATEARAKTQPEEAARPAFSDTTADRPLVLRPMEQGADGGGPGEPYRVK